MYFFFFVTGFRFNQVFQHEDLGGYGVNRKGKNCPLFAKFYDI